MTKRTLDMNAVQQAFVYDKAERRLWQLGTLQVVAYVAVGGGMLGKLFAEHPANAYIDGRVGKLPYSRKDIENIRQCLCTMAEVLGFDPRNLPAMPDFHNCGVF
jgi:hypothetical protein